MQCYIVTFEVSDEDVRGRVRERLEAYGHFCPIHKYCWAIMSDEKPVQIRSDLAEVLGPSDRLFVVRSGTESAWWNSYGSKHNEWLKKYL